MNDRDLFFGFLRSVRRKLWMSRAVSLFYKVFLVAACVTTILMILARLVVILYLGWMIGVICGIGLLVWVVLVILGKPTWKEAAHSFDENGLEDRAVTMLECLDDQSEIADWQRKDALKAMRVAIEPIKRKRIRWVEWKRVVPLVLLAAFVAIGFAYPNGVMNQAKQAGTKHHILAKKKQELAQFVRNEKKKLNSDAQKALEALKKKAEVAKTPEDLMKQMLEADRQLQRLKKEAKQNRDELQRVQQTLKGSGLKGLQSALASGNANAVKKQMDALQKKLSQLHGAEKQKLLQQLEKLAKAAGQTSFASSDPAAAMAALQSQLAGLAAASGEEAAIAAADEQLRGIAQGMNKEMAAAGLAKPGEFAQGSTGSASGQTAAEENKPSNAGESAANGSGAGNGSGTSSGNGSGSGSGSGSGNGSGTGSGIGQGGNGQGGNGAGNGMGNRNLLTVPRKLNSSENKEVDGGALGEGASNEQETQNPAVMPGKVRPYQDVYGSYKETYRQSVNRLNLPGHLHSIVKDYFSNLAPNGQGD